MLENSKARWLAVWQKITEFHAWTTLLFSSCCSPRHFHTGDILPVQKQSRHECNKNCSRWMGLKVGSKVIKTNRSGMLILEKRNKRLRILIITDSFKFAQPTSHTPIMHILNKYLTTYQPETPCHVVFYKTKVNYNIKQTNPKWKMMKLLWKRSKPIFKDVILHLRHCDNRPYT